ncbi:MAG: hypothetical protein RBJ76_03350 [Stenomitos frigidus ULC029]
MCNAWNHSPSCNCGWGGDTGGFGGSFGWVGNGTAKISEPYPHSQAHGSEVLRDVFESQLRESETRKTKCWWCGAEVYYHTNGYGDCVLFDELGCPWLVHECWETHRKEQSERFYARVEGSIHLRLAVLIGAVKQIKFLPDECSVASQMGISLGKLRRDYGNLYRVDPYTKAVRIISSGQVKNLKPPIKRKPKQQIIEIRRPRKIEKPRKKPHR